MAVEWLSDAKMETFIANWGNVLTGCKTDVDDSIKKVLFLKQVRKSQRLRQDLAHFDRMPEGHEDKSYAFLRDAVRRQITLARLEANRSAHSHASQSGAEAPALPVTGRSRSGKGKEGKGKERKGKNKGSRSRSTSKSSSCDSDTDSHKGKGKNRFKNRSQAKNKARSEFKGKGKGNDSRSSSAHSVDRICWFYKKGTCKNGNSCRFRHESPSASAVGSDSEPDPEKQKGKNKGKTQGKAASSTVLALCALSQLTGATGTAMPVVGSPIWPAVTFGPSQTYEYTLLPGNSLYRHHKGGTRNSGLIGTGLPWARRKSRQWARVSNRSFKWATQAAQELAEAVRDENFVSSSETQHPPDSQNAEALLTLPCPSAAHTGPAYWLMDSGSCFHLISADEIPEGNLIEDRDDVRLSTASGPITVSQQTQMELSPLNGPTQHLILEHAPAVLSVGRLCVEQNFSFHWEGKEAPYIRTPSGSKIELFVYDYVPYLQTAAKAFRALPAPVPVLQDEEASASSGSHVEASENAPAGSRSQESLKAAARDIWHLMTHRCKNPYCSDCQIAKMHHRGAYRHHSPPPRKLR